MTQDDGLIPSPIVTPAVGDETEYSVAGGSELRTNFFALLRRNPVYLVSTAVVVSYLVFSAVVSFFPWVLGYNPLAIDLNSTFLPPSWSFPFGTDSLGRSLLFVVLRGAPLDAVAAVTIIGFSFLVGLLTGTIAGYFGGAVDSIIMRVTDVFLAFPGLVLAVAVAAALGPGLVNAIVALAVVWWPIYTRISRGETLSVKENQYILAARAAGVTRTRIVTSHVVPNVLTSMVAYATADIGNVIIIFSLLGYLGLGSQPPVIDLGRIVYDGQNFIQTAPWDPIIPGVVILVIVLCFTFTGDMISELLNPRRNF